MSEYTPTMDEVRTAYKAGGGYRWPERGEQFDRFLEAHDRALREQIAQEIEALIVVPAVSITDPLPWDWKRAGMRDMQTLAARIARGEGSE